MNSAWERARQGRICALVGESLGAPPATLESVVIRVLCRTGTSTLAPILEAREKVERLLDAARPLLDLAADRVRVELRRHLLGETDEITRDAGLCESLQRLSRRSPRPCILVFDAVELADSATIEALHEVVRRARIGLILVFRDAPADPAAQALLELVSALGGQGAVHGWTPALAQPGSEPSLPPEGASSAPHQTSTTHSDPEDALSTQRPPVAEEADPAPELVSLPPLAQVESASSTDPAEVAIGLSQALEPLAVPSDAALTATVYRLPELPRAVIQVLRAGALIGAGFEAALVADLLELSELHVLEHLQHAFDSGVPIEDQGDGRFVFEPEVHEALRAQILPSLAAAWHRKLARLLTEERMAPPDLRGSAAVSSSTGHLRPSAPDVGVGSAAASPWEAGAVPAGEASSQAKAQAHSPGSSDPADTLDQPIFGGAAATTRVPEPPLPGDGESTLRYRHIDDTPSGVALPFGSKQMLEVDSPDRPQTAQAEDDGWTEPSEIAAETRMPSELDGPEPFAASSLADAPAFADPQPDGESKARSSHGEDAPRPEQTPESEPRRDAPRAWPPTVTPAPASPRPSPNVSPEGRRDPARAAAHLLAVGELDGAAERLLAASEQAERLGAFSQAVSFARQAVAVLERLPSNLARRQLLIRCWLALGRLTRDLQGRGPDFTLDLALKILEGAQQLLQADDPVPLQAELLAAMAGVLYDLGDRKSLDQALDALTQASRLLQAAGDATGAARLLNDQAAVWVRLGDPVRAWYLLGESRKVFESRAETDPVAMEELAETDHLLARLTFHVPARPGKEAEAVEVGLNHARAAEAAYKRLKAHRALARVWETQGRLHLMGGRIPQAQEKLQRAMEYQEKLGDLLGLARTVGVMAELLANIGELDQALSLLRESIVMNVEQGSSQGLETTQQAFETLLSRLRPLDRERSAEALQATQQQLARASRWIARRS